jgi:hypothetical protein
MISHLFKTDLRRTRILLGVWALLIAVQSLLAGWSVRPGDQVMQGLFQTISLLIPLVQVLLLVVIVPHLIQEEPLVGTTAFWFTRPISRRSLLGAKALFASVLIGIPLFVEVGVLAANGVIARDIGLAIPEIILAQLSVVVYVATLAVLTPNFGRFAVAGAIILFALVLFSVATSLLGLFAGPDALAAKLRDYALIKSRTIVSDLIVVFGGGSVIISQYLTRRTRRSVVLALVVGTLIVLTGNFWPWTILRTAPLAGAGEKIDPAGITLSINQTTSYDIGSLRGVAPKERNIRAVIETLGLQAGYIAVPSAVRPVLTLADGTRIEARAPAGGQTVAAAPSAQFVFPLEYALGMQPIVNGFNSAGPEVPLLGVDSEVYRKYADQPLKLTADLDMQVSKYVIVAQMPIVRGSRYDNGSEHLVITDVLHQGTGVDIIAEQRDVSLLLDGKSKPPSPFMFGIDEGQSVYLLCNWKRHEAVIEKQGAAVGLMTPAATYGPLVRRTLVFSFGPSGIYLTPDLTDAWLADATLVRLQLVPVGKFTKQLVDERFKLGGPNRSLTKVRPLAGPNEAALERVALPEHPTKAQVREYVDSLLAISQRVTYTGLLTEMLKKVGHENIDVLLDVQDSFRNGRLEGALDNAIQQIAQRDDKKVILDALEKHPLLADVVLKNDWAVDARETLLAALKDNEQKNLPADWIRAIASLRDPATYPDLKTYMVRCRRKQETYNSIRKLPGIDLDGTVDLAWKEAKLDGPVEMLTSAGMAAGHGHLDAIDEMVKILRNDESTDPELSRAAAIVKHYTGATGDNDAIVTWFEANRARLVFDAKEKKFVLGTTQP